MEEYQLWRHLDPSHKSPECRYVISIRSAYSGMNRSCLGTYAPDPTDSSGINSDPIGITFVTFDSTSGTTGKATPRIFVGVANVGSDNLFVSNDAGTTCKFVLLSREVYLVNYHPRVCDCWNKQQLDSPQGRTVSQRASIVPFNV